MGQNRGKNAAYFIAGRVEPDEKVCYNSPKRRGPPPLLSVVCAAFGAGIFLALFCSLKLVLILTAVFLVVLGALTWDP